MERIETGFFDENGNPICSGDEIIFNDKTYVVFNHGDKDPEWRMHPCGSNQDTSDSLLSRANYACTIVD